MSEKCKNCLSTRLATISGKCSDCFSLSTDDLDYDGYVPNGIGIGGGDYIELFYCLDCGMIQSDEFPVSQETLDAR